MSQLFQTAINQLQNRVEVGARWPDRRTENGILVDPVGENVAQADDVAPTLLDKAGQIRIKQQLTVVGGRVMNPCAEKCCAPDNAGDTEAAVVVGVTVVKLSPPFRARERLRG